MNQELDNTDPRRTAVAADNLLANLSWGPIQGEYLEHCETPFATHVAKLILGDCVLTVYQLNTGARVIAAEDLERFFGVEL